MNRHRPSGEYGSLLGAIAALGLAALFACASAPTDPVTNVSVADYRSAIARIQSNLTANVIPAIQILEADDLASSQPRHKKEWWDAKVGFLIDSAALCSDTLAGSTVKK